MPSSAIASIATTSMTTRSSQGELSPSRVQADEGRERGEGADGQHVAVRELDDVEHAEEQREADRDQRIHHAEHQPVHDVLRKQPEIHVRLELLETSEGGAERSRGPASSDLLLARQLALAAGVFAVVPLDELAVLDHVFGDHRRRCSGRGRRR